MDWNHDERSVGGRAPFLIGAQLGLVLLALPCAVSPTFVSMFRDMWRVLPFVTKLVLSPMYGVLGGLLVLGMLVCAYTWRVRLAQAGLLAWGAVLLGSVLVMIYVFGLYAPMRPL